MAEPSRKELIEAALQDPAVMRDLAQAITGAITAMGQFHVQPPPRSLSVDMDRDGPCSEAFEPLLTALLNAGIAAGWHPAEVLTAMLSWALNTLMDNTDTSRANPIEIGLETVEDLRELVLMWRPR